MSELDHILYKMYTILLITIRNIAFLNKPSTIKSQMLGAKSKFDSLGICPMKEKEHDQQCKIFVTSMFFYN